jgi:hypothetical protein
MAVIHDTVGEAVNLAARVAQAVSATTSAEPAETSQAEEHEKNNSSSSPLLFFVALGFGVVFTNLW